MLLNLKIIKREYPQHLACPRRQIKSTNEEVWFCHITIADKEWTFVWVVLQLSFDPLQPMLSNHVSFQESRLIHFIFFYFWFFFLALLSQFIMIINLFLNVSFHLPLIILHSYISKPKSNSALKSYSHGHEIHREKKSMPYSSHVFIDGFSHSSTICISDCRRQDCNFWMMIHSSGIPTSVHMGCLTYMTFLTTNTCAGWLLKALNPSSQLLTPSSSTTWLPES